METDVLTFHRDNKQFSTTSFLCKTEQEWGLDSRMVKQEAEDCEDFQHIMSEWQEHVSSLHATDHEELDLLNTSLLDDSDCPGLANELTHTPPVQTPPKMAALDSNQRNMGGPKIKQEAPPTSPRGSCLKTFTLITAEKEILGKNIIGLQCLNDLTENPNENCQETRTVIQGRRVKIIIRPKSQNKKRGTTGGGVQRVEGSLLKSNVLNRPLVIPDVVTIKQEPKEDAMTSEMQNGVYELPELGADDLLQTWDFSAVPPLGEDTDVGAFDDAKFLVPDGCETKPVFSETPKVPPLRIKIPKEDKSKEKNVEEEIDVVGGIEGSDLKSLLESFESVASTTEESKEVSKDIKSGLPPEMVDRLKASRRKKDCRIGLIQALPSKKTTKSGMRMQDAAAAMHRNKLLSILSSGDSTQLDHDYCTAKPQETFVEKNPKKDSGLESGDVSDASEELDPSLATKAVQNVNTKILEERRRSKNHASMTKVAAAYFRQANAVAVASVVSVPSSDELKTVNVSNGSKVKTEAEKEEVTATPVAKEAEGAVPEAKEVKEAQEEPAEQAVERPKKKLKLEEYLSRRIEKQKQLGAVSRGSSPVKSPVPVAAEVETVESATKQEEKEVESGREERKRSDRSSISSRSTSRGDRSRSRDRGSRHSRSRRSSSRSRSMWSRSRSRSSRSSSSSSSSRSYHDRRNRYRRRSRTRSRSRDRSRSWHRRESGWRRASHHYTRPAYTRSRSPHLISPQEKQRQIEERRVIYVGRIEEDMSKSRLRERFSMYGPVVDISLHFREHGDNYGFVTFAYKSDAFDALEHANDDPSMPRYDLCFGGRRGFCKQRYADLDGMPTSYSGFNDTAMLPTPHDSFDRLLKQAQATVKRRHETK